MSEPQLDGAEIDAGPQAPSRERSAELVKPEALFIKLRALGRGLQAVQEVELNI